MVLALMERQGDRIRSWHDLAAKHIKKLKATGYDGTITLEVFASERDYLLLSRELLKMVGEGVSHAYRVHL
jgi:sugar phosphate isomerase/epimerase